MNRHGWRAGLVLAMVLAGGQPPVSLAPPTPVKPPAGDSGKKIDLSSADVMVANVNARAVRNADSIVLTAAPTDPRQPAATVTFTNLTCADDYRIRWRIQRLAREKDLPTSIRCWPLAGGGGLTEDPAAKTWYVRGYVADLIRVKCPIQLTDGFRAAFREDGINEIAMEKLRLSVTVWVNGIKIFNTQIPADQIKTLGESPVQLWLSGPAPDWACKATLVTFVRGKALLADPNFGTTCLLHAPPAKSGAVNLSAGNVQVNAARDTAAQTRPDHFVMTAEPDSTRDELSTTVTFRDTYLVDDTRIRWRVEPAGTENGGSLVVTCPPMTRTRDAGLLLIERAKTSEFFALCKDFLLRDDCKGRLPDRSAYAAAFRPDGVYELCLERRGKVLSAWAGPVKLVELELDAEELAHLGNVPIQFTFTRVHGRQGMKVSLVEFTTGKDVPPAASQPAGLVEPVNTPPVAGNDLARTIDLAGDAVQFQMSANTQPDRQRNCFVLKAVPEGEKTGRQVTVTLGGAAQPGGPGDARVRWRIEPSNGGKPEEVYFHGWPMPERKRDGCMSHLRIGRDYFGFEYVPGWESGFNVHWTPRNARPALASNGVYELCFEKRGRFVTVAANSVRLLLIDLTDRQAQDIDGGPITFWLSCGGLSEFKVTLLECVVGKK